VERATGIGGLFIRARDPKALAAWYQANLGIPTFDDEGQGAPWEQAAGTTAFSTFASGTDYFGRPDQQWMVNFRVTDLEAMLAQLRAGGATITDEIQDYEGLGRFCWATDPEGNRFELWEPAPD
jgi:predicted enzyme related to lactoylglutathione lyase